jgi:hypothetical protein
MTRRGNEADATMRVEGVGACDASGASDTWDLEMGGAR